MIVLGSGASVRHGLPTKGELKDAIVGAVDPMPRTAQEGETWGRFKSVLDETDATSGWTTELETALQRVPLHEHPALHTAVIDASWARVAGDDQKAFVRFLVGEEPPLVRLFRFLLNSQHRRVTVIPPNYDRIADYAADLAGFCHRTGFGSGYIRTWQEADWPVRFYHVDLKVEERTRGWASAPSSDWPRRAASTASGW